MSDIKKLPIDPSKLESTTRLPAANLQDLIIWYFENFLGKKVTGVGHYVANGSLAYTNITSTDIEQKKAPTATIEEIKKSVAIDID